jgi:polyhydroxyalkanoate synthase
MQGAKRERCPCIVTDEQRSSRAKAARPAGRPEQPAGRRRGACTGHQPALHPTPCQRTAPVDHGVQTWSKVGLALLSCPKFLFRAASIDSLRVRVQLCGNRTKEQTVAKKGVDLGGADEANVALSPIIGLAREDLMGAVAVMLRETAGKPEKTLKHARAFSDDVLKILTMKSEIAPDPRDKRFMDLAWKANPFYKMGMQYYLAAQSSVKNWIEDLEVDDMERARASFVSGMIMDSLAPTNTLAGNPSAIKRAMDTSGLSLLKGLQNAYNDIVHNDMMVSQVDSRPFKIGENIAIQPGAVVLKTEMMELMQYAPTTEEVHETPLLIIPPQINKAYINDLTPEKSIIKYELDNGIQPFLISWRNPSIEHRAWGLDAYVDEIIEAIDATCAITGATHINVAGACSGGITTATLLSKLKARKDNRIKSATLMVCVLQPERLDSDAGALVSDHGIKLARQRSAEKGILEGNSLARMFAWLRPNDLVWNYVINNYLHGDDPPAFDILFWNNDSTNLTAALHSDYLRVYEEQPFANPGQSVIADHAVDLSKVDCDIFILAGVTDHITPWKACYRTTQLLGAKNIEFVLSHSGHIQAILNPPGNPKAKFYRAKGKPPETPEKWLKSAEETAGSWWPYWMTWLQDHSGKTKAAPKKLGNSQYPAGDPAPGRYAFDD